MNELFILGELMEGMQNGYQLRNALQTILGHNRKISFGTLYPLLNKLEKNGLIIITIDESDRKRKDITITEAGRVRFIELMEQPVLDGAYKMDIYLIKLDAMQHLDEESQKNLLNEFKIVEEKVVVETLRDINHLAAKQSKDHWYAAKILQLRLAHANATIKWIIEYQEEFK
ncbi:MAG: PadR family transcriptional regulator [Erysipelotrichales bacterium]